MFLFINYSSFNGLNRITAWILRFINICRVSRDSRSVGTITAKELNGVITCLAKINQRNMFVKEIKNLRENKPLSESSSILILNPFVDKQGVLRVGGRIRHSVFIS